MGVEVNGQQSTHNEQHFVVQCNLLVTIVLLSHNMDEELLLYHEKQVQAGFPLARLYAPN